MPATRAKTPEKRVRRTATKKTDSSIKPTNQDSGSIGLRKTISTLAEFNAMIDYRIQEKGEFISLADIMDERLKVLGY